MWALIAFIILGIVVMTLIEINERIKAKKHKKDCPPEKADSGDCSACELMSVCTKEEKSTAAR
jgi:hypothetical protein